jgi:hypothetical protein
VSLVFYWDRCFSLLTASSRVLLAQDREEIYVTIAEYTLYYLDYLQNLNPEADFHNPYFLKMRTYGPFLTTSSKHMAWLGATLRILLPYAARWPSRGPQLSGNPCSSVEGRLEEQMLTTPARSTGGGTSQPRPCSPISPLSSSTFGNVPPTCHSTKKTKILRCDKQAEHERQRLRPLSSPMKTVRSTKKSEPLHPRRTGMNWNPQNESPPREPRPETQLTPRPLT